MPSMLSRGLHVACVATPLGPYVVSASEAGVAGLCPAVEEAAPATSGGPRALALVGETAQQLGEYFEGRRRAFTVPLDLQGTVFQRRVWEVLLAVPYAETRSYAWAAARLGIPAAARAVGGAVGSNPVAIIVPCHRIVGADGSLTGYAGGLARKERLLALERLARSPSGTHRDDLS